MQRSVSRSSKVDDTNIDPNRSTSLVEFVNDPKDNDFCQANPDYFTSGVNSKYISIRNKRPSTSNDILGELESAKSTTHNQSSKVIRKEKMREKKRTMPSKVTKV